jgi:hypothetical protein
MISNVSGLPRIPLALRAYTTGRIQGICVGINIGTAIINVSERRWMWTAFSLTVAILLFLYSNTLKKIYDESRY